MYEPHILAALQAAHRHHYAGGGVGAASQPAVGDTSVKGSQDDPAYLATDPSLLAYSELINPNYNYQINHPGFADGGTVHPAVSYVHQLLARLGIKPEDALELVKRHFGGRPG